jgi:hypothetical protein
VLRPRGGCVHEEDREAAAIRGSEDADARHRECTRRPCGLGGEDLKGVLARQD